MQSFYKLDLLNLHLGEFHGFVVTFPCVPDDSIVFGVTFIWHVFAVQVAVVTACVPPGPVIPVCTTAALRAVVILVVGRELMTTNGH